MSFFDPATELAVLRSRARVSRQRRYCKSRLDQFAGELVQLRQHGATIADLQRWLRQKRVRVHHTTVSRWIARNG